MKRIVFLLQVLTSVTVITVNGIVLYQFLNRAGCTQYNLYVTNLEDFQKSAGNFGNCVKRAVNQKEFPKKEIPSVELSPSEENSPLIKPSPLFTPSPLIESSPLLTPSPLIESSPLLKPSPSATPSPSVKSSPSPEKSSAKSNPSKLNPDS